MQCADILALVPHRFSCILCTPPQTLKDLTRATLLPAWARDVGIVLQPLVSPASASLASQDQLFNLNPDNNSQAATERPSTSGSLEDDQDSGNNIDEMRRTLSGSVGPGAGPNDPALSPIPGTSQYNLATGERTRCDFFFEPRLTSHISGLPGIPKLRQKKILVACNFCRSEYHSLHLVPAARSSTFPNCGVFRSNLGLLPCPA